MNIFYPSSLCTKGGRVPNVYSHMGENRFADVLEFDKQKNTVNLLYSKSTILLRAIDGARTRGLDLGKVARYQLRHYRISIFTCLFLSFCAVFLSTFSTIHHTHIKVKHFFKIFLIFFILFSYTELNRHGRSNQVSRQTKILVLHMKELVYTAIFLVLGVILVILLVTMFGTDKKEAPATGPAAYIAGVYTSSIDFQNRSVDVQVIVDENRIKDISLVHLEDTVSVMYPLMEPTIEQLRDQILDQQSLDGISYEAENQYTSAVLLRAIGQALAKAAPSE